VSRRESRLTLRSRLIMAGLIVLVYGIACFLPALEFVVPGVTPPRVNEWPGWAVLASGPFPLGSPSSASWCANILLLFDLLFLLRGFRWLTLISSCLTLPLGLCVFGVFSMKFFFYSTQWVLQSLQAGAWVWLASLGMTFLAALILWFAPIKVNESGA
jgi:hypothetical protein